MLFQQKMDKRAYTRVGLWIIFGLSTLGYLLGYLGNLSWSLDLLAHFRMLYCTTMAACVSVAWLMRYWRTGLSMLAICIIPITGLWPYVIDWSQPGQDWKLHILHHNLNHVTADKQAFLQHLNASEADLVFIQEYDAALAEILDQGLEHHEVMLAQPRHDAFGIAVLRHKQSKLPQETRFEWLPSPSSQAQVSAIAVSTRMSDSELTILSLHALPPISESYAATRDQQISDAGLWLSQRQGDKVLVGDLNATPWCAPFRKLKEMGFLDTAVGRGWKPTWPASLGPFGIPIDHCLVSSDRLISQRELGPSFDSDHRSVSIYLRHH